uniref:AlNc14C164G7838 protein n=1 Tax=Albugo laibachii Nc14 TaxID=890382 RepID=F0WN01_9STRA|nr:AlNc14C164G7838 [Albugo laibachii Nc14]|eukprot:CCA22688.1 AlNc14C164G7838 [Albugo laibachii Nc14]
MSPTDRIADSARPPAPTDVVDSSERATDHIHEEKSEVPEAALVKVLPMLGDLSKRMGRTESSQSGQARQHRKESAESSVFDSVLGVGEAMKLQDLVRNPSPKRSPNLSPATYFGDRLPAQVAGNYDMGQAPKLGVNGQRLPDYHF